MYHVAVIRDFIARHYLIGGDWGSENQEHAHHYRVEVELYGQSLNEHQYLVDIVAIEDHLGELIAYYRDRVLNELPEFTGVNPSLETFARILCQSFDHAIQDENVTGITVRLWENENAWAGFSMER